MNQPQTDPLDDILQQVTAQLLEHFDSVRIICTSHVDGSTALYTFGGGNIYAQEGSVKDWVIRMDALEDNRARVRVEQSEEDDGDDDDDGGEDCPPTVS